MEKLELMRKDITRINNEIIVLMAKRIRLVKKIFDYKRKDRRSFHDCKREKEMIKHARKKAERSGVNADFAENIL